MRPAPSPCNDTRAEEREDGLQYGGECDGIDRDEFEAMLRNLDGFSDVLDGPVANDEVRERVAAAPGAPHSPSQRMR